MLALQLIFRSKEEKKSAGRKVQKIPFPCPFHREEKVQEKGLSLLFLFMNLYEFKNKKEGRMMLVLLLFAGINGKGTSLIDNSRKTLELCLEREKYHFSFDFNRACKTPL